MPSPTWPRSPSPVRAGAPTPSPPPTAVSTKQSPKAVASLVALANDGYFDHTVFHRIVPGFVIQGGDPKGTGEGGSDLPDLKAEFNDLPHVRGTMSMARAEGLDSANSQFFIMLSPNLRLDGKYSPFGRVVSGMAYVDAIEKGEPPANPSKIVHASIGGPAAAAAASPDAANAAAAAAAETASQQSSEAALASQEATKAAAAGDAKTAKERAKAARVSAEGAAEASRDAAEAAGQATPPQN